LGVIVGLSVLWPLDPEGMTALQWFGMLTVIELCVVLFAWLAISPASYYIVAIHLALASLHVIQFLTVPYTTWPSVYSVLVPVLEGFSLAYICFTSIHFLRGYHGSVGG
jgi:hypothetical protein